MNCAVARSPNSVWPSPAPPVPERRQAAECELAAVGLLVVDDQAAGLDAVGNSATHSRLRCTAMAPLWKNRIHSALMAIDIEI
jgi:hypothetical protein